MTAAWSRESDACLGRASRLAHQPVREGRRASPKVARWAVLRSGSDGYLGRMPRRHTTVSRAGAQLVPAREPEPPVARDLEPDVAALLAVQVSAGNVGAQRAMRRSIARAPLSPAEKAENLKAPRYAGQRALEDAYDNSPAIGRGATGGGVRAIQAGLVDAGIPMPISTKGPTPDGIFGDETHGAVLAFQTQQGLTKLDGVVGRETMGKLDELGSVGMPEIPNRHPELGAHVAAEMEKVNEGASQGPDKGVWYDYNYFRKHQAEPGLYPWDDEWRSGLASPEYFHRNDWMDWTVLPGKSASAAIKAWIHGLTIAECLTAIVAIEIDTIRAALGDLEFDRRYGPEGGVAADKPLRIHAGTDGTPADGGALQSVAVGGSYGARDLKIGDWVYFYNHPKYLLKHPGGAWQGENAVYTGDNAAGQQLFTGLGAVGMSEDAMLQEMVGAYSGERDGYDYVALLDAYCADQPEVSSPNGLYKARDLAYTRGLYLTYIDKIPSMYREDSGEFPDTCTGQEILDEPPYTIGSTTRKGGFTGTAHRLDPAGIKP